MKGPIFTPGAHRRSLTWLNGKYLRRRTRLAAHDPENTAQVGDTVEITPCRRLSKSKSWRLVRIIRRGQAPAAVAGSEV